MREIIRLLFTLRRAALPCCLLFALFGAAAGAAQPDKAVYEKALEQKAEGPGRSGGLGKYSSQGLALLAGIFIGVILSRIKRSAAAVEGVAAARAPVQPAPPARLVPPPAQPQPSSAEDEELNIPSRSGFYKRR